MCIALVGFLQPILARLTTTFCSSYNLAAPRHHTTITASSTDGPGAPNAQLALSNVSSAGLGVLRGTMALLTTIHGRSFNAAVLIPLICWALAFTFPSTPVAKSTIHGVIARPFAPLRLHEGATAKLSTTSAFLHHGSMPLTELHARWCGPFRPRMEGAILRFASRTAGQIADLCRDLAATAGTVHRCCEKELILVCFLLAQNKFSLSHQSASPAAS